MTAPTLTASVRALTVQAVQTYAGTPHEATLRDTLTRLDGPLRVAIAGRVKAGKSTLLNALVGERIAPTDAGECTRIVTWYAEGTHYRATAFRAGHAPQQIPLVIHPTGADVALDGLEPGEIERLEVQWPSPTLRTLTFIDTPGIESTSSDVADRTWRFLAPEDRAGEADAVLYLMRHLHSADTRLLEAFHDTGIAQPTPVNAIGVLSRADEIGVGRADALESAGRIARRYEQDRQIRRLCQTVLPVAGLLACSGATLTEAEYQALAALAAAPAPATDAMLLSADGFAADDPDLPLAAEQRRALLLRFGIFGIRLALTLLRSATAGTARELSAQLVAHSGVQQLRDVLTTQFSQRADVLKARSAVLTVGAALRDHRPAGADALEALLEQVEAGAHELAEVRLLNALRTGTAHVRDADVAEAERLLGASGTACETRLGLPEGAPIDEQRAVASDALARWQYRAEDPLASRDAVEAARVVVRTCEGILASLG